MSEERTPKQGWRYRFAHRAKRTIAERRRLLLRLGIVAVALVVLVIVPGYISSRPHFLQRYARLDAQYQTWSTSVHAKVPCQKCHVRPQATSQLAYNARMLGEFYLSFVAPSHQPKLFAKPTNAACRSCHYDLRTVSPSGDLNIPHRAHVEVLKLKCINCHSFLVHEKSPEGKNKPRMAGCLKCHDGRTAKNKCSACHTDKVEPLTHRAATWVVDHPKKANAECNKCHKWTDKWCSNCHTKRPKSHVKAWRAVHRDKIATHRNCEACHKPEFCVRCHGEVPNANLDPALKLVQ